MACASRDVHAGYCWLLLALAEHAGSVSVHVAAIFLKPHAKEKAKEQAAAASLSPEQEQEQADPEQKNEKKKKKADWFWLRILILDYATVCMGCYLLMLRITKLSTVFLLFQSEKVPHEIFPSLFKSSSSINWSSTLSASKLQG